MRFRRGGVSPLPPHDRREICNGPVKRGTSVSLRRTGYCWRIQSQPRKPFKFGRIIRISSLFGEFANSINSGVVLFQRTVVLLSFYVIAITDPAKTYPNEFSVRL